MTGRTPTWGHEPPQPDGNELLWRACCDGTGPAEALPTRDRADLVAALWERGWTDQQIADHTRMTRYTTARIRARLGLEPNEPVAYEAA